MDQLHSAVAREFASRYCPINGAVFLTRFWMLFALTAVLAAAVFLVARRGSNKMAAYIVAGALLLFAIGSGALVLYGLSGCSAAAAAGLTWDWP